MNLRHWQGIGLLSIGITLGGCATPPAQFYSLSALPEAGQREAPLTRNGPSLGIGPFQFPEYLDQPQLVVRQGKNRLQIDEFHRWGDVLPEAFPRILGENLAHLLHSPRILVYPEEDRFPVALQLVGSLLHFEGTVDGKAVLRVRWALLARDKPEPLLVRESTYTSRIQGQDRAALVQAMSQNLGKFSQEVAQAIRSQSGT